MIKYLTILLLVATPAIYADWMDELAGFVDVEERTLDSLRAEAAVQKLLDEDKETMEKHTEETNSTDSSFWGTVTGYLNVAKWGVAKKDSWYHQQVLDYIKELPKNQLLHDGLVDDLIRLIRRNQERELLLEEFEAAQSWKEKVIVRGYIVAKKTQILGLKKLIEKRVFIS